MIRQERFPSSIWPTFGLSKNQMTNLYCNDIKKLQSFGLNDFVKSKNEFVISTWNVHSFKDPRNRVIDIDRLSSFLKQDVQADVLSLQEYPICSNDDACDELFSEIRNYYDQEFPFKNRSCIVETGHSTISNVTLSNYPIETDVSNTFSEAGPSGEDRCFTVSQISLSKTCKIRVINLHLDVWDGSGKTRKLQIEELLKTYQDIKKSDPLPCFLCGDLNATKKSKTYDSLVWKGITERYKSYYGEFDQGEILSNLESNGFVSAFEYSGLYNPSFTVWNGTTIDWIMVDFQSLKNSNLKEFKPRLHPTLLSDHCALSCSFIIT